MSTETLYVLLPEIILILFATAIYLAGAFFPRREGWHWLSAGGLLLAAIALFLQGKAEHKQEIVQTIDGKLYTGVVKHEDAQSLVMVLDGQIITLPKDEIDARQPAETSADTAGEIGPDPIGSLESRQHDPFSAAIRWSVLALGLALVIISSGSVTGPSATEFLGSLLLMIAGLMIVAMAEDLVLIFAGLELVSIPTYVILYLGRGGNSAQEATTKYFFLSILSSALLLYGFSFLYGVAGSTDLTAAARMLLKPAADGPAMLVFAKIALVLIFAGLGFRVTLVPFHFYAPDVYQGTSHLNAGVLAVVTKVAGLTAMVRIIIAGMTGPGETLHELAGFGWMVALVISLVTMTLGNLVALWQQNIRRLLAYSSVAHGGYMMIGVAVAMATAGGAKGVINIDGVGAMLFYLLVYAAATLGAFALLAWLSDHQRQIDNVDDLAGLWRSHPWAAAVMAIFMFSLTGLPPFAGFFGKFTLFLGALGIDAAGAESSVGLRPWFLALAIVGVINAAISAGYYLRVVSVMFFRPSLAVPAAQGGFGAAAMSIVCAGLVIALGFNPASMIETASRASQAAQSLVPASEGTMPAAQRSGSPGKSAPAAKPAFAPAKGSPSVS